MAATTPTSRPASTSRAASSRLYTGWIGFASITLLVIAGITALEGLIAIVRDRYYVVSSNQVIVFDISHWGWVMLVWGLLFAIAGLALAGGRTWARWFTIVVASLNVLGQLAFLGSTQYPLWTLAAITLDVVVLYALTVHWADEV
jgi:hypothetical protein